MGPFMAMAGCVSPQAVTTVPEMPAMASAQAWVVFMEQKADVATGWMPRYALERRAGPMATTASGDSGLATPRRSCPAAQPRVDTCA